MFVKSESQYLPVGTIARIKGFTGTIVMASVELDADGVAGWPTYTMTAPATGRTEPFVISDGDVIEIPV